MGLGPSRYVTFGPGLSVKPCSQLCQPGDQHVSRQQQASGVTVHWVLVQRDPAVGLWTGLR